MYGCSIYVQATSRPISDATHMLLFYAAQRLVRRGETQFDFKTDAHEGRVRDLGKSAVIGAIAGPFFEANVDVGDQSVHVTFIVRRADVAELLDGIQNGTPFLAVTRDPFEDVPGPRPEVWN